MAWSPKWYVALLAAQFVGTYMEQATLTLLNRAQETRTLSWTLGFLLQVARSFGLVALGVLYDRVGPHVPLAISNLSFFLYGFAKRVLGLQGLIPHTIRIMAHPVFGFIPLGLWDCPPEDRTSFLARMYMMSVLGIFTEDKTAWLFPSHVTTCIHVVILALHAVLSIYLTTAAKGECDDVKLARKASASPTSLQLPAPTSASFGVQRSAGRLFLRPEVYTTVVILVVSHFVGDARNFGMHMAAGDKDEDAMNELEFQQVFWAFLAIVALTWSYLPAKHIDRLGPKPLVEVLLQFLALVDVVLAVAYLLPMPGCLGMLRTLVLQCTLVVSKLAQLLLLVVCSVFFAGITGPSERGTVLSFMNIFDGGKGLQPQWYHTVGLVYQVGGPPPIYSLCAASSIALLLLYRGSVLVKFRLKDV